MNVTVSLSGDGIEFEREVSESTALSIMELSISDGANATELLDETDSDDTTELAGSGPESLPDNFFNRLSTKQEALLHVLHEADEPLTSTELRRRMSNEYDVSVGGGRGLAGIFAGFTRKYGDDFSVVQVDWGDGEGIYQLNPDHPDYIEEIAECFEE